MTDKKIKIVRKAGGDWFVLIYSRKSKKTLKDYLCLFDYNDYWIYKVTKQQREVSYEDFLEFRYSGYIFFKKENYSREHINKWFDYIIISLGGIQYFNKPVPPFDPEEKIIIK